jgi:hypothetical protein
MLVVVLLLLLLLLLVLSYPCTDEMQLKTTTNSYNSCTLSRMMPRFSSGSAACMRCTTACCMGPWKARLSILQFKAIAPQRWDITLACYMLRFELACCLLERSWAHVEAALVVCHGAAVCCCCGSRSGDVRC